MSRLSGSGRIGVGVIGLGHMGGRHAENAARRIPHARLVAVFDAAADLARRVAAELDAEASGSVGELVARDDIGVVVVASPSRYHAEHALTALEAGKDVLLEKPMAQTLEDCDRVARAAERAGARLQVGFMRRYDAAYAEAHRLIRSGALGEPLLFSGSSRDRDPARAAPADDVADVLLESAIHDFDLARWLLGDEVARVSTVASARRGGSVSGAALTTIELARGALAHVETYRGARYAYDIRTEVVGERGTVMVGDRPARASDDRRLVVLTPKGEAPAAGPGWLERFGEAYLAELDDFVSGARERRPTAITAADGRAAVAVALAGAAAFAAGRSQAVTGPATPPRAIS